MSIFKRFFNFQNILLYLTKFKLLSVINHLTFIKHFLESPHTISFDVISREHIYDKFILFFILLFSFAKFLQLLQCR